jgi:shikimate dehydrogenase
VKEPTPHIYNERFDFSITPRALAASGSSSIHVLLSQSLHESHTFELYANLLRSRSSDAVFLPFEVNPEDEDRLADLFLEFRRSAALKTIMVSDPFKQRVQSYIDTFTDRASNAHSVNLISKRHLEIVGDNLDGLAFEWGLKEIDGIELINRSVLFFGCGGVSSAIATLLARRLRTIGLTDIDHQRADALRHSLPFGLDVHVLPPEPARDLKMYNTLYNGTGLGKGAMVGRTPLLDEESTDATMFIDAIYTPSVTRFLQQGARRGARIINGSSHMFASTALHCSMIIGQKLPVTEVADCYCRLQST